MERNRATEGGWFPLRGSYEEAVLSWYEQIEASFRRRELEVRRTSQDARRARTNGQQPVNASPD
jgi:hypothetical protein